jgi:sugar phosphate isomerase/epimerase
MLWTILPKQPFERRVATVAEAGYHAVELVKEYNGWSASEFSKARRQLQQLGMVVDACSWDAPASSFLPATLCRDSAGSKCTLIASKR